MTDEKEILELIEQAAKKGRTELGLSSQQLTSLPPEIAKLIKVTCPNLSSQQLPTAPPCFQGS
jgi:hypothetical protein